MFQFKGFHTIRTDRRADAAGVPLVPDREQAWRDFAGWRVNYDKALTSICELVEAPFATWSSDRYRAAPSHTRGHVA